MTFSNQREAGIKMCYENLVGISSKAGFFLEDQKGIYKEPRVRIQDRIEPVIIHASV